MVGIQAAEPPMTLLIVLLLAVLIGGVLAWASVQPNTFRMERTAVINASPAKVHALINDFHEWTKWSPWEHVDADLKRTYSGAAKGVGAEYGWEGQKTGVGHMLITESTPSKRVLIKLDFLKPFEAHNICEFTLSPEGKGTRVLWAMYGPQPFFNKLMGLVFSMEKIVGPQFDQGLAAMKAAAEAK